MQAETAVRQFFVALAAALLLACTSAGDETSSATSTPATTSVPEASPTPAATVLDTAPTIDGHDGETPGPVVATFGSWIIDVETGDAAQLGDDANSPLSLRDSFTPAFTPDGSGVWLSRRNWTDARRYGLDGTLIESIEGAWAVIESADGRSRAYYLRGDGDLESTLVAERDGVSHRLEGRHALPGFSPDGHALAYYAIGEDNVATLDVLDLETGAIRTLATEVDPCACDLTPHPKWSPSGTHLAYYDFEGIEDSGSGGATFVVNVASGERTRVALSAPGFGSPGWFAAAEPAGRLVLEDGFAERVSVFDLATGATTTLYEVGDDRLQGVRLVSDSYVEVDSLVPDQDAPVFSTRLFDGETGESLARWDYEGDAAMTTEGPALAVYAHALDTAECDGTLVIHPALELPVCLAGVESVTWSLDGGQLATLSREDDGQHIGLWDPSGGLRHLATVPGRVSLIGWNPAGTHLFVSDISGL